ncbi:type II toxin-antitoxin system HicB family antitoxin [Halocynthiibacter sp. C4]|uniref:type II toxin-antitoxin system HicB family antitoxin n=1 Tax=Halocynthiibacter sp. C4 TaxID=2992758 RepID=UPI00237AA10D|nr:type II toxin-antitoxin system HicB family antitoxin [Halocynthiibacter sp. C4]MDE0590444.1 type II toxin-antitoxin system HicB family antitoxin [Halocynthiibacter sp. C4]
MNDYPVVILPLDDEDGGGYLATYPDLPGCMSDGDTPEEALENAKDAFQAWMEVQTDREVEIPAPGSSANETVDKVGHLLDALKATIDYAQSADKHIETLEDVLQQAIEKLQSDLPKSAGLLADRAKATRLAPIH